MTPHRRYRCRFCGRVLPGWLPAAQRPNGALLRGHVSQAHPYQLGPSLDRMHRTEDIAPVAAEAYEVVEEEI